VETPIKSAAEAAEPASAPIGPSIVKGPVSTEVSARGLAELDIPVPERIDEYVVEEVLGAGGMAVIYRSVQESLGRTVALKVLRPDVAVNKQFASRFDREAQTLATLHHQNILQIHDHRSTEERRYMVVELVDGVDLYDLLDRYGQLPTDVAAVIALQLARGLEHAHFRGIIHRDVKPANVMLSRNGTVKLMDFGIARIPDKKDLTQQGTGLGTPADMSPEQVVGDPLDGRSDLFALGVVLYQMVVGQKPFTADDSRQVLRKIRKEHPASARRLRPDLPRDLERIIGRCMQKNPQDRYWPTREVVRALERHLVSRGVESENAVLITFFMENGVIPMEEGQRYLEIARRSGYAKSDRRLGSLLQDPRWLWTFVGTAAAVVLLIGVCLGAGFSGGSKKEGRRPDTAAPLSSTRPEASLSSKEGGLRVVVRPWAEVHIDGQRAATTPIARPLRLNVGKHAVSLQNPHCVTKTTTVDIGARKISTLVETLECRGDKKPAK
jgi:serine/threonine-protein kinase